MQMSNPLPAKIAIRLKHVVVVVCIVCASACSDSSFDATLRTLSGNDYLNFGDSERVSFIEASLARYTIWRFWERPDLCESILNVQSLADVYDIAARQAGDELLVHAFVVTANERCIEHGEVFK